MMSNDDRRRVVSTGVDGRENMAEADFLGDVGGALAKMRHAQGVTQTELSNRTGITQADISRIEHGSRNTSMQTLLRLVDGLGLTMDITFSEKEE